MITPLKDKLVRQPFGLYVFAFLIPINPKWYGIGILFLLVEALIRRNFNSREEFLKLMSWKNSLFWLLLFYILHFTGMLYSSNSSFGWMDIGMKASFVIFPLYFLTIRQEVNLRRFMQFFIVGALLSAVICYFLSTKMYLETGKSWHFRESYLSHFMHRSYWATYLSIAFIFSAYLTIHRQIQVVWGLFIATVFIALVFITGSKAGILTVLISAIACIIYWAKQTGKLRTALALASSIFFIFLAAGFFVPAISNRLASTVEYVTGSREVDPTSTESTTARILMWETATELIKEQPFLGVGTGDVKDVLIARNLEKGYTGVAEKQMNAHNQFLNSWLALGVLGLLSLLALFILPYLFVRESVFIFRLLLFILFFSLIPESFLETQAGIIPTAFLLGFISLPQGKER